MLYFLLKNLNWKSFAIGAGTALYGPKVARGTAVRAVKVGMRVADVATDVYSQAATEFHAVKEEAVGRGGRRSNRALAELVAEVKGLRQEVGSLKAAQATPSASA